METVYVIIKHEHIRLNDTFTTPRHFENPLCFDTEKEAAERIKKEIRKDTSNVFSIEKRYVATKDEKRKALIP